VIGFDINRKRIGDLRAGVDIAREVEPAELAQAMLVYESDPAALTAADFYIVTVLTLDRRGQDARSQCYPQYSGDRRRGAETR
jgi:UDP-N-acetyl-D-mannosaminuronate dehydrogenase